MRSSPADQPRPQRRRFFQFTLRTLLIATAVAAALAFAWMKLVEPYRLQREAMAAITRLGGNYTTEDATGWVRYLDTNAQDVVVVDLAYCDKPDEYLPQLARLPRLKTLVVGGHSVGDEHVEALGRAGSLRGLVLDSTQVSDECVEGLKVRLPDVAVYRSQRRACFELRNTGVRLHDFRSVRTPKAKYDASILGEVGDSYFVEPSSIVLVFFGTGTRAADLSWLTHLEDVGDLRFIRSQGMTGMSDDDLAHVMALGKLRNLSLSKMHITDKGIAHLEKCSHLEFLDIEGTGISPEGVQRLKAALPHCTILR